MITNQLDELFKLDYYISHCYKGIYPIDTVPHSISIPSLFVVNLDPSYKAGSHWVVLFYRNDSMVEYFDSRGIKPPNEFTKNLFSKRHYLYNTKRLQDYNTDTCGLYCLYYSFVVFFCI